MDRITQLRKEIDKLDAKIIEQLSKRFKLTKKVGKIKIEQKIQIESKSREQKILNNLKKIARNRKINEKLIEKIYKQIFVQSKKEQKQIK